MKKIMMLVCLVGSLFALSAETESPWSFLASRAQSMEIGEDRIQGPGFAFLVGEARHAQFFLVGEQHGIAEVPFFTGVLFQAIQRHGYDRLVIETGPFTAEILTRAVRSRDPETALTGLARQYPFSVPFYFHKEEAELIRAVATSAASPEDALWGIDQEFVLAPGLLFDRLADLVAGRELAKRLRQWSRDEQRALDQVIKTKRLDPGAFFMFQDRAKDLADLADELTGLNVPRGRELAEEIKASMAIYLKYNQGKGYENNAERALLNKRHFMDYYRRSLKARPGTRALIKMGATHVAKGHSPTRVLDVGNRVSELAEMEGSRSFHLLVMVLSGTQNLYVPFRDEQAKKTPIQTSGNQFSIFADNLKPDRWTVYDLRPLRARIHQWPEIRSQIQATVLGYDAILVIPEGHASTNLE